LKNIKKIDKNAHKKCIRKTLYIIEGIFSLSENPFFRTLKIEYEFAVTVKETPV